MKDEKVLLIGAGGHCSVIIDILKLNEIPVYGITDKDTGKIGSVIDDIKVIDNDDILYRLRENGIKNAIVTVGSIGDNSLRKILYNNALTIGFKMINAIHPSAIIAQNAILCNGTAVMAGVIVNSRSTIGNNVVLNTGCIIEHDAKLEDNVFIAPGVVIAGGVSIGEDSFIGLGARIIQNVRIGRNVLVGAGSVILKDVPDNSVITGVPGKITRYRNPIL